MNFSLYTGWVCEQVYQWYRMRRAFADNEVRKEYQLPRLEEEAITERARKAAYRLFPPCTDTAQNGKELTSPLEAAIAHLLAGKSYMSLNVVQRVALMRLLVEACYETRRIAGIVEGNNLARVNAEKKLESDTKAQSRIEREQWGKVRISKNDVEKQSQITNTTRRNATGGKSCRSRPRPNKCSSTRPKRDSLTTSGIS